MNHTTTDANTPDNVTRLIPPTRGSGAMFDAIAERYDLLNRLMSLGLDRGWRRRLVRGLGEIGDGEVLDLATGTGDVALAIAKHHDRATVVGADTSSQMMAVGATKAADRELSDRVSFVTADAQALPFEDQRFAATCIAFGIRNVPDRFAALREMARVTRRGGRVLVLELTEPTDGLLAPLARFHIHQVVPRLGAWLSGKSEYRYLERSVAAFPAPTEFAERMADAGLAVGDTVSLGLGAAHLFFSRAM